MAIQKSQILNRKFGDSGFANAFIAKNSAAYVLGRFDLNEQQIIDDIIKVASDSLEAIIKNGIQFAMNKYNNYKHDKLLMSE